VPRSPPPASARRDRGARLEITSNLDNFGEHLRLHRRLDGAALDDQEFANCEQAVKTLQEAQDWLEEAEEQALARNSRRSTRCAARSPDSRCWRGKPAPPREEGRGAEERDPRHDPPRWAEKFAAHIEG
jgi:hypothetical protein